MLTDIEIAKQAKLENIKEIASKVGLAVDDLNLYGDYKAKVKEQVFTNVEGGEKSKKGRKQNDG